MKNKRRLRAFQADGLFALPPAPLWETVGVPAMASTITDDPVEMPIDTGVRQDAGEYIPYARKQATFDLARLTTDINGVHSQNLSSALRRTEAKALAASITLTGILGPLEERQNVAIEAGRPDIAWLWETIDRLVPKNASMLGSLSRSWSDDYLTDIHLEHALAYGLHLLSIGEKITEATRPTGNLIDTLELMFNPSWGYRPTHNPVNDITLYQARFQSALDKGYLDDWFRRMSDEGVREGYSTNLNTVPLVSVLAPLLQKRTVAIYATALPIIDYYPWSISSRTMLLQAYANTIDGVCYKKGRIESTPPTYRLTDPDARRSFRATLDIYTGLTENIYVDSYNLTTWEPLRTEMDSLTHDSASWKELTSDRDWWRRAKIHNGNVDFVLPPGVSLTSLLSVPLDVEQIVPENDSITTATFVSTEHLDLEDAGDTTQVVPVPLVPLDSVVPKRGAPRPMVTEATRVVVGAVDPSPRHGADVDEARFLADTGFRGIQYGNWTNQAERQAFLNGCYDAMFDLAHALHVPVKWLSLPIGESEQRLGIAIGARGRGGAAAAHYEPTLHVINLTKNSGTGSLGHEIMHAIDYYLGTKYKQGSITAATSLSSYYPFPTHPLDDSLSKFVKRISQYNKTPGDENEPGTPQIWMLERLRQYLFSRSILDDVAAGLKDNPELHAKVVKAIPDLFNGLSAYICDSRDPSHSIEALKRESPYRHYVYRDGSTAPVMEIHAPLLVPFMTRCLLSAGYELTDASDIANAWSPAFEHDHMLAKVLHSPSPDSSTFHTNAILLNGGKKTGYWTEPTELLARAGHAIVHDRLEAVGISSAFLTHTAQDKFWDPFLYKGNPNLSGSERGAAEHYWTGTVQLAIWEDLALMMEQSEVITPEQSNVVRKTLNLMYSHAKNGNQYSHGNCYSGLAPSVLPVGDALLNHRITADPVVLKEIDAMLALLPSSKRNWYLPEDLAQELALNHALCAALEGDDTLLRETYPKEFAQCRDTGKFEI